MFLIIRFLCGHIVRIASFLNTANQGDTVYCDACRAITTVHSVTTEED